MDRLNALCIPTCELYQDAVLVYGQPDAFYFGIRIVFKMLTIV